MTTNLHIHRLTLREQVANRLGCNFVDELFPEVSSGAGLGAGKQAEHAWGEPQCYFL